MKTNSKNISPVYSFFVALFLLFFTGMATAQTISGPSSVNQGSINDYTLSGVTITSWNVSGAASWTTIGGGVRVTAGSSNFTVSANFTQAPNFTAKFVTVNVTGPATPGNPSAAISNCQVTLTRTGNPPSGVTWYWQGRTSNGTATNEGSGATYSANEGSGTYYIRARNSSGQWSPSSGTVNVTMPTPPPTPTAPTVSANNCDNTVIARSNPPSGITWYWQITANGTSTANAASTITKTNGTIQYLRARNNSTQCWSTSSASRTYSINYSPSAPLTPTIDAQNCGSTVLRRADPNPTANVTWYWQSTASGTSTANSQPTISLNSGTVYYLRAKTNGATCWGPARPINYTIDNGPAQPAAPTIQSSNCGSVVLARSNPPSGVTFYWQSSASGTSTSSSGSTITRSSGSIYYLRARNSNGCWSSASSVNYTIGTAPAAPSTPTVSANNCDNTILTRSNPPSGVTWYWQNSATGTDTSNSSSTITKTNGTIQYLRARNSAGCWSDNASSVTYDITYSPSAPLSPTVNNNCGTTVLTRDNPNPTANVTWYWQNSATGTSTANSQPTLTLSTGTVHYLRAKTNGANCWGPARTINYTIDNGPATPPTPTIASNDCGSTVLSRANPQSGVTYYWQTIATGTSTSQSGTTITLTTGTTHYLRARNNSSQCWSAAASISYTIDTPPDTPATPTVSANDCGSTVLARSNPPTGITWYWQDTATGTNTDNSSATITKINGTIQYLRAKSNNSDCWSAASSSVNYTVTSGPSAPLSPTIENFCGSTVLTRDNPNPTAPVTWYWQSTEDGTSTANGDLTVTLTSGTVYYLRAKTDGTACWGEPRIINYTVNQIPGVPSGAGVSQCNEGSFNLVAGLGANSDTLRWYDVVSGGTSIAFGETFTTPIISETTIYFVESFNSITGCVSGTRHAIQAEITGTIVWYLDADGDGFAPITGGTVLDCNNPGPQYTQNVLPLTDCNDSDANINPATVWYADTDIDGLGDPNSPSTPSCTQPTGYVNNNNDQCPTISSSSNNCNGGGPNDPLDQNYVYTRAYQAERTNTTPFFTPNDSLIQTIGYFDGQGRPIQQIGIDHTPDKADVVTFMNYDDYGRVIQEFLPYPETDSNLGTYRLSAESKTSSHYNIIKYQNTSNPFSETAFEFSPLNRPLKKAAPGNDWAMGNGHEIEFDYLANTSADNIKRYRVTLSFADNTFTPSLILDNNYPAGELTKTITYDENHTSGKDYSTEEFMDKQGRIILKRNYNNAQAHDTQYVYDDFGNLSYVLTPKMEPSTASLSQVITNINALGYRYVYDQRNRLVVKQIPGKGEEHMIYNALDQPIMTQDANQRLINEWIFTKYDQFGRVAYTGTAVDTSTRETIQGIVNNLTTPLWVVQGAQDNYGGTDLFYNNGAYPTGSLTEILTINYYDNYNTSRSGTATSIFSFGIASSPNVQGLATESRVKVLDVSPAKWNTSVVYYDVKGRTIQTYLRNEYLTTTDKIELKLDFTGRTIQSRSEHARNGTTIVTLDNFSYDHVGRLLAQTQCIGDDNLGYTCDGTTNGGETANLVLSGNIDNNQTATVSITIQPDATVLPNSILQIDPNATGGSGAAELIVLNTYDELGRLDHKKIGGESNAADILQSQGLQTVNYNYNVREWLTGINDNDSNDNDLSIDTDDLFAFKLNYNNPILGTPLFNGNISQTQWRTKNEDQSLHTYTYGYDALNRITHGIDNTGQYNLGDATNPLTYDKNGNIETLVRVGHIVEMPISGNLSHFGIMDNLDFDYTGNQLTKVRDDGNTIYGFKDSSQDNQDYAYDVNGNMISDANKEITSITYNHLNLPISVTINGSESGTITYIYDALGVKQKKEVSTGTSTEYTSGFVYENGNLEFLAQPQGYVAVEISSGEIANWSYVYQYKDHLDNIRLSYTDKNQNNSNVVDLEILKENNYYPFGLEHKGYNEVNSPLGNSVANRWKFGGKEFQEDLNLEWYDITARNYDPALGRWMNIDPLAEKMRRHSPYNYAFNNPVFFVDYDGMMPKENNYPPEDVERTRSTIKYKHEGKGKHTLVHTSQVSTTTYTKNDDGSYNEVTTIKTTKTKSTIQLTKNEDGGVEAEVNSEQSATVRTNTATVTEDKAMHAITRSNMVQGEPVEFLAPTELDVNELIASNEILARHVGGITELNRGISSINATPFNQPFTSMGEIFGGAGIIAGLIEATGGSAGVLGKRAGAAGVGYALGELARKYIPIQEGTIYDKQSRTKL